MLESRGLRTAIRLHPADSRSEWRHLAPDREFEVARSIRDVVRETTVGILAYSTVFLECAASGVPTLSMGWYPFPWADKFDDLGIITRTSSEAETVLQAGVFARSIPPSSLRSVWAG